MALRDFLIDRALKTGALSIVEDVNDWSDDDLDEMAADMSRNAVEAELEAALSFLHSVLTVKSIRIVCGMGTDKVMLMTSSPSPTPKVDDSNLALHFEAARGTGADYCRRHFPGVGIEEIHV